MNKEVSSLLNLIKCPVCVSRGEGTLLVKNNFKDVQKFWEADFKRRFKGGDYTKKDFEELLKSFEKRLHDKEHLLVRELNINDIENNRVLEIGSGAGAHASLIKSRGACKNHSLIYSKE